MENTRSNSQGEFNVPLRKSSVGILTVLMAAGTLLPLLGVYMILADPDTPTLLANSFLGVLIAFLILVSILIARLARMFGRLWASNAPGLKADRQGLHVAITFPRAYTVRWSEIQAIKEYDQEPSQLNIVLKRPDSMIEKQDSRLERAFLRLQNWVYGTPVAFSTWVLKMDQDVLRRKLQVLLHQYSK